MKLLSTNVFTAIVLATSCAGADQVTFREGFEELAATWEVGIPGSPKALSKPPAGWIVGIEANAGRGGSAGLHLARGETPQGDGVVERCWLPKVAPDTECVVTAWVRGEDVKHASITARGYTEDRALEVGRAALAAPLSGTFAWKQVTLKLRPARAGLRAVRLAIGLIGGGRLWVDDVQAVAGEKVTAFNEPGIQRAQGRMAVVARRAQAAPIFQFPLPLDYETQVPLTFKFHTEPADALASVRLFRAGPHNVVAEWKLKPMQKDATVTAAWSSLVLCAPAEPPLRLPEKAPWPMTWPDETQEWRAASWAFQSDSPQFRQLAAELTAGTEDVSEVIRRAVAKVKEIAGQQKADDSPHLDLTAQTALQYQGSCTSAANLLVALLRASGVPARSVACYPLWAGPHQTHSIIEAHIPSHGWYPIESTMCKEPWERWQQVLVAINSRESEDRAGGRRSAAAGVPFLQLNESIGPDGSYYAKGTLPNAEFCDHIATPWANLPANAPWSSLLARARVRWQRWIEIASSRSGAVVLATPLREEHISKSADALLHSLEGHRAEDQPRLPQDHATRRDGQSHLDSITP
ncbi:MAG: transglutaminase-like domain-containing protein [Verrucomicrobiota bacterium]|nr:transglutaminase-like domain-containing protein [Verrucomicrobiota bacterium]